jgi:tetratricopeptide (TPR) repeat protein
MKHLQTNAALFFSVALLLMLASCGGLQIRVKNTLHEAHQHLLSGDFQKALDLYQWAHEKDPRDAEILNSYIQAIEYIKTSGDEFFNRNDFVRSQTLYDMLVGNFPRFSGFANQLSFEKQSVIKRLGLSRALIVDEQAQSCLKKGEFQKALDFNRDLYLQYPEDAAARYRCVRILEAIKERADLAFQRSDFALAGATYRILLKNYSFFSRIDSLLSYDSKLLDAKIKHCRKILFGVGLEQYRSGNLIQAISVWKSILAFVPEDPEIKKVVDTAILQSRNLEKMK